MPRDRSPAVVAMDRTARQHYLFAALAAFQGARGRFLQLGVGHVSREEFDRLCGLLCVADDELRRVPLGWRSEILCFDVNREGVTFSAQCDAPTQEVSDVA